MVDVEQVGWVVAPLDLDEPVVVALVRGPKPDGSAIPNAPVA